jgi:hypothetical protein
MGNKANGRRIARRKQLSSN